MGAATKTENLRKDLSDLKRRRKRSRAYEQEKNTTEFNAARSMQQGQQDINKLNNYKDHIILKET